MCTNRLAFARLFFVWAFTFYCASAQNAPTSNNVILKSSSQSSSNITLGQTNTLTVIVANTGGNAATILVDLELIDSTGHKVDQKLFDNQLINPITPSTYQMTTSANLPTGTYHFSVGLFHTAWTSRISWNDSVQSFTVGSVSGSVSDVVLDTTALGEFHLNNCPVLTVLLNNNSSSTQTVLVDIELKDSGGNRLDQEFFDSFSVPSTLGRNGVSVVNHCSLKLADGTYFYSVGIFTPHWNSLVHWYSNVQQFTVKVNNQPDVVLQSSSESAANINPGQSNILTAVVVNTGPQNRQVLVDLELINASNTRVDQKFFNNVTLAPGAPISFNLITSTSLSAGTYHLSVGIFNADWNGLIHWYNAVQTFTISSNPSNLSSIVLLSSNVSKTPITGAQTTTASATIQSNNAPTNNAIVELIIFDQTNKSRFMEAHSAQSLPQDQPMTYSIASPSNLPAGTYRAQLAVYDSTRSTTLVTFGNIGSFVVQ